MSKASSTNEANSTPVTTTPEAWEHILCVQYGFPEGKGAARAPKLRTIFEPIPEGAHTASPVYVLSREQYENQKSRDNPYRVKNYTSIATELQDECEADDRVLYPIHIESDEFRNRGLDPLIEWFQEFVEGSLDVPLDTCRLYYSGNRSLHVHVPRFVSGEDQRERLKKLAETFCEETGAELDCGLYYAKRMFRLPGVEHEKTGVPKIEISRDWSNAQIARKVDHTTPKVPESYADVLQHVFVSEESLTVSSPQSSLTDPLSLFRALDSDKTVLELDSDERDIETPLVEQTQYPDDPTEEVRWLQYNAKEFSPYAHASGNDRSVAVIEIKDGAFARKDVRNGTTLIPAYFYGARGCAGEDFTKHDEHAPLQLSPQDYTKWDYSKDNHVVIIGGQSRSSRIFAVDLWQAKVTGRALSGEGGSREAALDYLTQEGYDTGSAGQSSTAGRFKSSELQTRQNDREGPRSSKTEAAALQRRAEKNGIKRLSHTEQWRVACRLLNISGWDATWEWFKQQYGPDFDPGIAYQQLKDAVDRYPSDYADVDIPSK